MLSLNVKKTFLSLKEGARISAEARQQHFLKEFSEPDSKVEYLLKCDLNQILSKKAAPIFIVSLSDIRNSMQKIKKPFSRGTDNIFAKHILLGSPLLFCHLELIFHMVFTTTIVPILFSSGCLSLVPKNNKLLNKCSSFSSITVATTFSKIF